MDRFNSKAGWQMDCVAKCHGRSQNIWFPNGDDVLLGYNATKYKLFIKCCHQTPMEVMTIPIQWIDHHIDDLEIDSGTKPIQKEQAFLLSPIVNPAENTEEDPALKPVDHPTQGPKEKEQGSRSNISTSMTQEVTQQKGEKDIGFNWKDIVGHYTNEVLVKMLENTTQCFSTHVESETCTYHV
eukprot:10808175-Ditylum_brightwellii.AAC.1